MVDPIKQSGLNGIHEGLSQVAESAQKISSAFTPAGDANDAVDGVIGMHAGERLVKASTKIIKVSEEMDQAVLDILA